MSVITENCDELATERAELRDRKLRIDTLQAEIDDFDPEVDADSAPADAAWAELNEIEPWTTEDQDRLDDLDGLNDALGNFGGLDKAAEQNCTLIGESTFVEYARDYAHSLTDLDVIDGYVDWDAFASDLRTDYQSVSLGRDVYLVRS